MYVRLSVCVKAMISQEHIGLFISYINTIRTYVLHFTQDQIWLTLNQGQGHSRSNSKLWRYCAKFWLSLVTLAYFQGHLGHYEIWWKSNCFNFYKFCTVSAYNNVCVEDNMKYVKLGYTDLNSKDKFLKKSVTVTFHINLEPVFDVNHLYFWVDEQWK